MARENTMLLRCFILRTLSFLPPFHFYSPAIKMSGMCFLVVDFLVANGKLPALWRYGLVRVGCHWMQGKTTQKKHDKVAILVAKESRPSEMIDSHYKMVFNHLESSDPSSDEKRKNFIKYIK